MILNLRTRYLISEDLTFRTSKIGNAGVDPSLWCFLRLIRVSAELNSTGCRVFCLNFADIGYSYGIF